MVGQHGVMLTAGVVGIAMRGLCRWCPRQPARIHEFTDPTHLPDVFRDVRQTIPIDRVRCRRSSEHAPERGLYRLLGPRCVVRQGVPDRLGDERRDDHRAVQPSHFIVTEGQQQYVPISRDGRMELRMTRPLDDQRFRRKLLVGAAVFGLSILVPFVIWLATVAMSSARPSDERQQGVIGVIVFGIVVLMLVVQFSWNYRKLKRGEDWVPSAMARLKR